jgi:hypothetical protein
VGGYAGLYHAVAPLVADFAPGRRRLRGAPGCAGQGRDAGGGVDKQGDDALVFDTDAFRMK